MFSLSSIEVLFKILFEKRKFLKILNIIEFIVFEDFFSKFSVAYFFKIIDEGFLFQGSSRVN